MTHNELFFLHTIVHYDHTTFTHTISQTIYMKKSQFEILFQMFH